jgi:hypothetical protein
MGATAVVGVVEVRAGPNREAEVLAPGDSTGPELGPGPEGAGSASWCCGPVDVDAALWGWALKFRSVQTRLE